MYAAAQLGNFSYQSSRSTLAMPCDITSCHMLCCGFVVVSMETEHNFEHNTYITVA